MALELYEVPDQPNAQQAADKVIVSDQTQADGTGYRTREAVLALLAQVATVLVSGDKVLFTDGTEANTRYRVLPNMAILDANNALALAASTDETVKVLTAGNTTATINVFVSNATPIGNITGTAGDICIVKNGVSSQIFHHIGAGSNNTDWGLIQPVIGACAGVETGGVTETVIAVTDTPQVGVYTLVAGSLDSHFSYSGVTYTYNGPTSTQIRHINVQVEGIKASGSPEDYAVYVYRKRGVGSFEQIGAEGITELNTATNAPLAASALTDLENGDEFQIWVAGKVSTINMTMVNNILTCT